MLKRGEDCFDGYSSFREHCLGLLEDAVNRAERCQVTNHERDEAFFAVVIWMDEIILSCDNGFAMQWRNQLLQRQYFQITNGGEAFFSHLDQLNERSHQARLVYLYCLQNGFQGMYSVVDGHNYLNNIIRRERIRCLGEDWCQWPNDAVLTPVDISSNSVSEKHKKIFLFSLMLLITCYLTLTCILILKSF